MAISSIIVAIEDGALERVLPRLGAVRGVSIFGVKDNQAVTVVEGETLAAVNGAIRDAADIDGVVGVYPVFAGEHA